ncbi:MAG: hypothetical protein KKE29_12850 [Proteobacteria bacterium]|nr:hypothetical protein [Pseudomonadota bacterium]MBU4599078.1 hypothetical protein [Pseudomonadota bacterium]MBV1714869.1 hypothetical protein [Desulfarculus sp.]
MELERDRDALLRGAYWELGYCPDPGLENVCRWEPSPVDTDTARQRFEEGLVSHYPSLKNPALLRLATLQAARMMQTQPDMLTLFMWNPEAMIHVVAKATWEWAQEIGLAIEAKAWIGLPQ